MSDLEYHIQHSKEQCQQSVKALKILITKSIEIEDESISKHYLESALQLCDQLLREPLK
jgi:hypothetical protein